MMIRQMTLIALVLSVSFSASAISEGYRNKLERSGCTQVTEANGTCDINKSKAYNKAHSHSDRAEIAAYLEENILGANAATAHDSMLSYGFIPNNDGYWHKGKHKVLLDVANSKVIAATIAP